MQPNKQRLDRLLVATILVVVLLGPRQVVAEDYDNMPAEDYKKLDTFEAHSLSKADKVFAGGDYKRAAAEYNSFMLEFPRSKAVAYALLRKARSLQESDRRNDAIKEYSMVLDYFPNQVRYAAAAMYYKGLSHWQNGDEDKAYAVWAQMAKDKGYREHPLAADALNRLAGYLKKKDQLAQAIDTYQQVAETFRNSHPQAAKGAINEVVYYYIKTAPNEPKLREFYKQVQRFDSRPRTIEGELEDDWEYWKTVRHRVRGYGRHFDQKQQLAEASFYKYWAERIDNKFPKSDEVAIDAAYFHLKHEKNRQKWIERIDELYQRNGQGDDYDRTIRFIDLLASHGQSEKVRQYVEKLDLAKLSNGQIRTMLFISYDKVRDSDLGRVLFGRMNLEEMDDSAKASLARSMWKRDPELVKRLCAAIDDRDMGKMELLLFHQFEKNFKEALPLAEALTGSPQYASEAWMIKGDLLAGEKKYAEAIPAYRSSSQQPDSLWKIVGCMRKLGQDNAAISQLREIENFFKEQSPRAALAIADVYRDAQRKQQYVAALRAVGNKYPKSSESRQAHLRLEAMGYKVTGGVDAEE
ncbi:MAG: tetratricopeptide repeat protein [Phycisphaerae bacterium]